MKILIVDDSRAMQSIVAKTLKAIGFDKAEFLYGNNGEEGLKIAVDQKPELALCDLYMPGMSGIELVEALKRKELPIKAGIVSVEKEQKYIDAALAAGADFFLQKPFTNKQLFDAIIQNTKINPYKLERDLDSTQVVLPSQQILEALFSHLFAEEVKLEIAQLAEFEAAQLPYIVCTAANDKQQARVIFGGGNRMANFIAYKLERISHSTALEQLANATLDKATQQACQYAMEFLTLLVNAGSPDNEWLQANELYVTETTESAISNVKLSLQNLEKGMQFYKLSGVASEFEGGLFVLGTL